jgi:Ras-related protein Rab-1A
MSSEPLAHYDHLFKCLLVGDMGAGKSSLAARFADPNATPSPMMTLVPESCTRLIEVQGKRCKLQIWDTAGQERFHMLSQSLYRGVHLILLVYDVTDSASFERIAY